MNQGKLDLVKQKMAVLNTNILGISELKWMGMGNNSWPFYLLPQARISRRNGAALRVSKKVKNVIVRCNLNNDIMISVCLQGKQFYITVI